MTQPAAGESPAGISPAGKSPATEQITTEQITPPPLPNLHGAPLIIAHRGASGERPEHTLAAYQLAIDQGADFIEPDLVLTKDGVLVVRHENEIGGTTDIADHAEFADRKTSKTIDGVVHDGWFTEDFTLAELQRLRAKERLADLRPANRRYDGQYPIATFEQVLQLLADHQAKTGRRIGVYPETKHPSYFAAIGLPHQGPLLALLSRYGYDDADDPIFIQSFEVGNLKALAQLSAIPLVQLIDSKGGPPDITGGSYAAMLTPAGLAAIAEYAAGIGPAKSLIIARDAYGNLAQQSGLESGLESDLESGLVRAAHAAGLVVHPWTFRRENEFLPTNLRNGEDRREPGDLAAEIKAFIAAGVDGIFTDNPAQAVAVFSSLPGAGTGE